MMLKAGDVRQEGDEVRRLRYKNSKTRYAHSYTGEGPHEYEWQPVRLIGHAILGSDLMVAEFRRGE